MMPKTRNAIGRMKAASLPVVDAETSLKAALARLRRSREKGVIARSGETFHLHMTDQLARACTTGKAVKMCELKGYQIHLGDMQEVAKSNRECFLSTEALLDNLLGSGKRYGLLSAPTLGAKHAIVYYAGRDMFAAPGPKDICPECSRNPCVCQGA